MDPNQIAMWLDARQGASVPCAVAVLQAVIEQCPRNHSAALILAEAASARALGWPHILPLLAFGFERDDLRKTDDELRSACNRAIVTAAIEAMREASDLSRRSERLKEVPPKLRAKGADEALALFLSRDAIAPAALSSLRSYRAARRFSDRLFALGAVRELTGCNTFRLYGV